MNIKIKVDGKTYTVPRARYVIAKTKQLKEFGYANLTAGEVDLELTKILEGKTLKTGLTVIGGFMVGEVLK
jgi:hypothetical protein